MFGSDQEALVGSALDHVDESGASRPRSITRVVCFQPEAPGCGPLSSQLDITNPLDQRATSVRIYAEVLKFDLFCIRDIVLVWSEWVSAVTAAVS